MFYMPYGEMTITLDDAPSLVGLSVTGSDVNTQSMRFSDAKDVVVNLLGVSPQEADDDWTMVRGQSIKLEWLCDRFSYITDDDNDFRISCCARAYLLYLVGCTVFSDKSGTRVSISYLRLFDDLDRVLSFTWGAACLVYLYRQLGYALR